MRFIFVTPPPLRHDADAYLDAIFTMPLFDATPPIVVGHFLRHAISRFSPFLPLHARDI